MDRSAFFEAFGLKTKTISVGGIDGLVIRELSAGQREQLLKLVHDNTPLTMAAKTVAMCCDIFEEGDDEALLTSVPAEVLMDISGQILALSGIGDADAKKD